MDAIPKLSNQLLDGDFILDVLNQMEIQNQTQQNAWDAKELNYVLQIADLQRELQLYREELATYKVLLASQPDKPATAMPRPSITMHMTPCEYEVENDLSCPICLDCHTPDEKMGLACGHSIGLNCGKEFFVNCMNDKSNFPVKCPATNEQGRCTWTPSEDEVILFLQDNSLLEKFSLLNTRAMISKENNIQCPFCQAEMQDNTGNANRDNSTEPGFNVCDCIWCHRWFCKSCYREAHLSQTCEEAKIANLQYGDNKEGLQRELEAETSFRKLAEESGWKPCPKCEVFVEKDYGCNHMECKICANHFCYLCLTSLVKKISQTDPCLVNCLCCHWTVDHASHTAADLHVTIEQE